MLHRKNRYSILGAGYANLAGRHRALQTLGNYQEAPWVQDQKAIRAKQRKHHSKSNNEISSRSQTPRAGFNQLSCNVKEHQKLLYNICNSIKSLRLWTNMSGSLVFFLNFIRFSIFFKKNNLSVRSHTCAIFALS